MVKYSQINNHNTSHKQKERQKYMIISIDAEKAFVKVQYLFMIKTLIKVGAEEAYLNITRSYIKYLQ